jgi:hypothetical protein
MPSKILKAVKDKQAAAGGQFWKPGTTLINEQTAKESQQHATANSKSPKPNLSKGVMSMKFMARKVEIADEERLEAKKRRKILDSGWSSVDTTAVSEDTTISGSGEGIVCTAEAEDLFAALPGRRSFGGFNKVVERFYQHSMDTQKFGLGGGNDLEDDNISNEEMASRYSHLIGSPEGDRK